LDGHESRRERRVLMVVGLAGLVAAWALLGSAVTASVSGADILLGALLVALACAGRLFPIQVAFRRRMVSDTAPLFAAALLVSPLVAGLVAGFGIALAETITGRRARLDPRQLVFNTSQAVLGTLAAAAVFQTLTESRLPSDSASVMWASVSAAVAMLAINDVLVFSVVWAQTGVRFRRMFEDFLRGRRDLPHDVALLGAGFVGAIAASIQPWLVLLLAVPFPVLHRAMRSQVALRLQTREACIAFADIVDARDSYTFGHCKRVAEFSEALCREIGLPHDMLDEIALAARIHDLGKIGVRDNVLLKPARLDEHEFCHMMEHPQIGARLTAFLPEFKAGTSYIRHHHEKWDGTGYPDGLEGPAIPLGARIIAVADTYDAITSSRVYREAQDEDFARLEMARAAGTQLDPEVTRAWFRVRGWDWPDSLPEPGPNSIVNASAPRAA
jgi:HD-GYP domain-containing protein (c-di-GMP phosphodiesterase class II)